MSEIQSFKRFPAVRCWIKHILEGNYLNNEKSLYTIFGKVKRVRIVATIIQKREIINTPNINGDMIIEDKDESNIRIEFDLDDGTGFIRATIWQANPEQYEEFNKGDIVDVVGLIRKWKDFISISPEIIKKVSNPNFILLRNAKIIKKIKNGEIQEIPEIIEDEFGDYELSNEIDVNSLFEDENTTETDDVKEKLYSIIQQYSSEGNGISLKDLKGMIEISEEELKKFIRDLEIESRIYPSEENKGKIYYTY